MFDTVKAYFWCIEDYFIQSLNTKHHGLQHTKLLTNWQIHFKCLNVYSDSCFSCGHKDFSLKNHWPNDLSFDKVKVVILIADVWIHISEFTRRNYYSQQLQQTIMWLATWAARSRVLKVTELAPPPWIYRHSIAWVLSQVPCKCIFTDVHIRNNYHPNRTIGGLYSPLWPYVIFIPWVKKFQFVPMELMVSPTLPLWP